MAQPDDRPVFSFELFPPKTAEGMANLQAAVTALQGVGPRFFSVTYGAGGSTRDRTFAAVDWLRGRGLETVPHLSGVGSHREEIRDILQRYQDQGIRRLVALRGDLPSGMGLGDPGEFRFANELVAHIRATTGDWFHLEVAAYPETHPQARSAAQDLRNFQRKVEAGADSAITQYFYNADAYFRFVDSCHRLGIRIPVVPGIMPITNATQLLRFSDACGAEIPRWIRKRLEDYEDDLRSIQAFGQEVVTDLCRRLLEGGAPGLHFYTMNQAQPTLGIWGNLGLTPDQVPGSIHPGR